MLSTIHGQYTVQDYNVLFHLKIYAKNIRQQNTQRFLDHKDLPDEIWWSWFSYKREELMSLLLHTTYLQMWLTSLEKSTAVSN